MNNGSGTGPGRPLGRFIWKKIKEWLTGATLFNHSFGRFGAKGKPLEKGEFPRG
ncbi:MAG: hypothetical protein JRE07_05995 [Deltaproteobacteria bacterium]|nr:hypothetical protein [Deltaproteobacteria bacterium]